MLSHSYAHFEFEKFSADIALYFSSIHSASVKAFTLYFFVYLINLKKKTYYIINKILFYRLLLIIIIKVTVIKCKDNKVTFYKDQKLMSTEIILIFNLFTKVSKILMNITLLIFTKM